MGIDRNKLPRDAQEFSPWQDMDGAPRIYGCDYCGVNIMPPGSEFRPANYVYTFCDNEHYRLWSAAQPKDLHWGKHGCRRGCSCGWDVPNGTK